MNNSVKNAAMAYISGKVLSRFRFRWLFYGAAAYYGLRYMKKHGIFEKQAGAGLDIINRGVTAAKEQMGIRGSREVNSPSQVTH
ncbi:MAG: hypothetical protein AB7G93_04175 [Bdellovibrionales bacterium]